MCTKKISQACEGASVPVGLRLRAGAAREFTVDLPAVHLRVLRGSTRAREAEPGAAPCAPPDLETMPTAEAQAGLATSPLGHSAEDVAALGLVCAVTWEKIDDGEYVEYQSAPSMTWHGAPCSRAAVNHLRSNRVSQVRAVPRAPARVVVGGRDRSLYTR